MFSNVLVSIVVVVVVVRIRKNQSIKNSSQSCSGLLIASLFMIGLAILKKRVCVW